jgi:hypothetical protein
MNTQPEALRQAEWLDQWELSKFAAKVLREQHASIESMKWELQNAKDWQKKFHKLDEQINGLNADIERKDALLRQALDAMTAYASTHGSVAAVRDARDSSIEAIRKELQ